MQMCEHADSFDDVYHLHSWIFNNLTICISKIVSLRT